MIQVSNLAHQPKPHRSFGKKRRGETKNGKGGWLNPPIVNRVGRSSLRTYGRGNETSNTCYCPSLTPSEAGPPPPPPPPPLFSPTPNSQRRLPTFWNFTAVSQPALWWFLQLVNIEPAAVPDLDVVGVSAALVVMVIAHFPRHYSLGHRRVAPLQPAGRERPAVHLGHAGSRHLHAGGAGESVPGRHGQVVLVALGRVTHSRCPRAILGLQFSIRRAFCEKSSRSPPIGFDVTSFQQ